MITGREAVEAFNILAANLRAHGYGWVLDQVDETVNLGKMRPAKAIDPTLSEDAEVRSAIADARLFAPDYERSEPKRKRSRKKHKGRSVDIERIEAFTPHERLDLLVDAIERVFVASEKMERETITRLQALDSGKTKEIVIDFESEAGERSRSIVRSSQRSRSAKSLSELCDMVRKAVQ